MDNVELLLGELRAEGFPTEQFESTMRANINFGLSPFKVKCERPFGDELMRYQLMISKGDAEDSRYQLSGLIATYRRPVDIAEEIFKGISAKQLDSDMAKVDWRKYFYGPEGLNDPVAEGFTGTIIMRLVKLANMKDSAARLIQQQLMYKHWPEDAFEIYRMSGLPDLKAAHEHSFTYTSKRKTFLNANLPFMVLSGRYDDLLNEVRNTKISTHGFDVNEELSKKIYEHLNGFSLNGSFNEVGGHVSFSIPVDKVGDDYSMGDYQVTFTPYPKIQHGDYNRIDTQELETLMQSIDWKNEGEVFLFPGSDTPQFRPQVELIQQKLYQLSQDVAGEYFSGILQLKYMQDTSFFEELIPQKVWNLLERLPKLQRTFPADTDIEIAVNLLTGRAVSAELFQAKEEPSSEWVKLDLFDLENGFPVSNAGTFSVKEMHDQIKNSPLTNVDTQNLWCRLMRGEMVEERTPAGDKVIVVANPEQKNLEFSTPDGRLIPVNFKLDPDWKPTASIERATNKIQQKQRSVASINKHARPPKKGRGKGL